MAKAGTTPPASKRAPAKTTRAKAAAVTSAAVIPAAAKPAHLPDGKVRCPWCLGSTAMTRYHDEEWGTPVHDDRVLFEYLILEGAQAGLSWSTILAKRDNYRRLFARFDPAKVARFTRRDVERLMQDAGIVRNRLKIESTLTNAQAFLAVQREFGTFAAFAWDYIGGKPLKIQRQKMKQVPVSTPLSDAFSRELKKRGFRFVGSTICYTFMQAVGMVDDHLDSCFRYALPASAAATGAVPRGSKNRKDAGK
jgi:DNA-3-methyladenine glycosylase I